MSMEFVVATTSQGTCPLLEGSNTVQCDLGVLSYGYGATIDVADTPTVPGEV